jgi:hypothetical protein
MEVPDEKKAFEVVGSSINAIKGTTAVVLCPAFGYPVPDIHVSCYEKKLNLSSFQWFKDMRPLQDTEKYSLIRNELHIRDVDDTDEGIYRCIAANEFPPAVDLKEVRHEAILNQQLRVTSLFRKP